MMNKQKTERLLIEQAYIDSLLIDSKFFRLEDIVNSKTMIIWQTLMF